MQITCANCKSSYQLTFEQVKRLPHSILPCRHCSRFIKIATCPSCRVYYSITFSSTQQSRYSLTCERCGKPFVVEFPLIRDGVRPPQAGAPKPKSSARASLFRRLLFWNRPSRSGKGPRHETAERTPFIPARISGTGFTLADLFTICGTAFTPGKIITAAAGIVIAFITVMAYGWLVHGVLAHEYPDMAEFARSLLNIVPFAIVFFIYIMSAAVVSRMTMNSIEGGHDLNAGSALRFMTKSFMPVFAVNIALFAAADLILILFGHVPIIGPVLFALLFLPIYAASLCIVVLLAVGFWFYPPIIAGHSSPVRGLAAFIRRHNLRLAYTIPLMTIITGATFAAIYGIHYGSLTMSMRLSKAILAEEGERIFSAIPLSLLQVSDLALMGTDGGLFRSLMTNILISHSIAGLIIGTVFSLISVLLFACFISISATLSTHVYLMMERGSDIDDTSKVRLLLALVLILAGMFLVKKLLL